MGARPWYNKNRAHSINPATFVLGQDEASGYFFCFLSVGVSRYDIDLYNLQLPLGFFRGLVSSLSDRLVQRLLRAGSSITARDTFGNASVHGAAHGGNPPVMRAVLDAGGDASARNGQGSSRRCWSPRGRHLLPQLL